MAEATLLQTRISDPAFREALSAAIHDQWAHWTRYMLEALEPLMPVSEREHVEGGQLAKARLNGWLRQIDTPYAELSEREKDSDREWADRWIAMVQGDDGS